MSISTKDKERIKKLVEKWKKKLYLQEWEVLIVFKDEYKDNVAAENHVRVPYMFSKIIIFKSFWNDPKKVQEKIIIHELCHCITERAYDAFLELVNYKIVTMVDIESIREQLTQKITNIAFPEGIKNE